MAVRMPEWLLLNAAWRSCRAGPVGVNRDEVAAADAVVSEVYHGVLSCEQFGLAGGRIGVCQRIPPRPARYPCSRSLRADGR